MLIRAIAIWFVMMVLAILNGEEKKQTEDEMVARTWHGVVPEEKADAYHAYLLQTGVPDYRKTSGNRGVYVLRRISKGKAHFLLVTLWESYEAIRQFAGDDIERARYYPEDEAYLLELEPKVVHYEVLVWPEGSAVQRPSGRAAG